MVFTSTNFNTPSTEGTGKSDRRVFMRIRRCGSEQQATRRPPKMSRQSRLIHSCLLSLVLPLLEGSCLATRGNGTAQRKLLVLDELHIHLKYEETILKQTVSTERQASQECDGSKTYPNLGRHLLPLRTPNSIAMGCRTKYRT